MRSVAKVLKALLITVLAYLIQVCVMQYFTIDGISGSFRPL